jgi:hypothetical protein
MSACIELFQKPKLVHENRKNEDRKLFDYQTYKYLSDRAQHSYRLQQLRKPSGSLVASVHRRHKSDLLTTHIGKKRDEISQQRRQEKTKATAFL